MTIAILDQFWLDCLQAKHDFSSHTFKMSLYDSNSTMTAESTTAYAATNEITGTGYTAGGATVAVSSGYPQLELIGESYFASVRFGDASWASSTFSDVSQALVYNATTSGNPGIALFTFPEALSVTSGQFVVLIPITQRPLVNILAGRSTSG